MTIVVLCLVFRHQVEGGEVKTPNLKRKVSLTVEFTHLLRKRIVSLETTLEGSLNETVKIHSYWKTNIIIYPLMYLPQD